MTMTRRQWIERLRTCNEDDLPYLTAMFQDWRQEELGEDPEPLQFESDMIPGDWYQQGPELVRVHPIRKLTCNFAHAFRSSDFPGFICISLEWIGDDMDVCAKAASLWISNSVSKHPDATHLRYRHGHGADLDSSPILHGISKSIRKEVKVAVLAWAIKEAWKLEDGESPYATPQDCGLSVSNR